MPYPAPDAPTVKPIPPSGGRLPSDSNDPEEATPATPSGTNVKPPKTPKPTQSGDETTEQDKPSGRKIKPGKLKMNLPMVANLYFPNASPDKYGAVPAGNSRYYRIPTGYRQYDKGYIVQDRRYADDWNFNNDAETPAAWGEGTEDPKYRWGFRFLWNPRQIGLTYSMNEDINPAVILSGKDQSSPMADSGAFGSIGFSLVIVRWEDMKYLKVKRNKYGDVVSASFTQNPYPTGKQKPPGPGIAKEIAAKGTMYDLEYLFKAVVGRAYPTVYRGKTADLGAYFGVPVVCRLSRSMTYSGRITSISIDHGAFTPHMVPIYTQVNLTVERFPDVRNPESSASEQQKPDTSPLGSAGTSSGTASTGNPATPTPGGGGSSW